MESHTSVINNQVSEKGVLKCDTEKTELLSDYETKLSDKKVTLSSTKGTLEKCNKPTQNNSSKKNDTECVSTTIHNIKNLTMNLCATQGQCEKSIAQNLDNVQNEKSTDSESLSSKSPIPDSVSHQVNILLPIAVKNTKAILGKNNKTKTRWSNISSEQYCLESTFKEKEMSKNTENKFCSQINKNLEKHNNVTVTFSKFEQFWEEQLSKKQFDSYLTKVKENEMVINDQEHFNCDDKISNSLKEYKFKNQSKELKNCSEDFSDIFPSGTMILPNNIPLPVEPNDDSSIPNIPLPAETPKTLLVVDIPLPNHEPHGIMCRKTELNRNDGVESINIDFSKKRNLNESMCSSHDNKYCPEDIFTSISTSSEQTKESLTMKPLLGRAQAKKRLQAFSLIKQTNKTNKKLLSPVLKVPKIQVSIIAEEQYNENGEKVGDKVILKKPPKKGPCPQEKAKAVISEIEEMKRHEAKMLLLHSKPGLYSLVSTSHKPQPVKSMPIPTEPKLINFNEQTAMEIKSLIEKVVSEEVGGSIGTATKSDSTSGNKSLYHDDKLTKGSRDRDHDRLTDKRKCSDKQKSFSTTKNVILDRRNEKNKKPFSWSDIKEWGYDYNTIRDTKERIRRSDENKDKFGLEIQLKSFDKDVILRYPFPVKSVKNEDIWFPRENIKYTIKSPILSYSENPVKYRNYPNRKQVISVTSEERKNIINEFLKKCERPEKYETLIFESRSWYPSNTTLNETFLRGNVKTEIPKIKSYGLSVLNENYKNTNWCDSDEETIENLNRTFKAQNVTNRDSTARFEIHNNFENKITQNQFNNNEMPKSVPNEKSKLNFKSYQTLVSNEGNLLYLKQCMIKKDKHEESKSISKVDDNSLSNKSETKAIVKDLVSQQDLNDGTFIRLNEIQNFTSTNDKSEYVKSPDTDEYLPNWELEKDIVLPIESVSKSLNIDSLNWESDDDNSKQNLLESKEKKVDKSFTDYKFRDSPVDLKSSLFNENKKYSTEYKQCKDINKYKIVNCSDKNLSLGQENRNILFNIDTMEQGYKNKMDKDGMVRPENEYTTETKELSEVANSKLKVDFVEHKRPDETKFSLDRNEYLGFNKDYIFEIVNDRKKPELIELEEYKERMQKVNDVVDPSKVDVKLTTYSKYTDEKKHRSSIIGELYLNDKKEKKNDSILDANQTIDNCNHKIYINEINNQNFQKKNPCDFHLNDSRKINLFPSKISKSQIYVNYKKITNDTIENESTSRDSSKSNEKYIEEISFQKNNFSCMSDWEEEEPNDSHSSKDIKFKKLSEKNSKYEISKESLNNWTEQNICDFRMKEKDNSIEKSRKNSTENIHIGDNMLQKNDYHFQILTKENLVDIRPKNENLLTGIKSPEVNEQNQDLVSGTNIIDSSFISINSKLASEYEEFMKTVAFIETSELSDSVVNDRKCNNMDAEEQAGKLEFNEIKDTFLEDKIKLNKKVLEKETCHSSETISHNENVIQGRQKQSKSTYKNQIVNYKQKKYQITSSSSSSNSSDTSSSSESDSSSETDSSSSSSSDSSSSSSSSSSREHISKKCGLVKIKTEKESDEEESIAETKKKDFIENNLFDSTIDNSFMNLNSKLNKEIVKTGQKTNLLIRNTNDSGMLLKDLKTCNSFSINEYFNDSNQKDTHDEVRTNKTVQFSDQTTNSKLETKSLSNLKTENEATNVIDSKKVDFSISFKVANLPISSEQSVFQKNNPVNMFPGETKVEDSKKSVEVFSEEINFSDIKLTTAGLSLYGDNTEEYNIKSEVSKKTCVTLTDVQSSSSMQKLRQFIPIKLLTNESRIQSIKLNSLKNKSEKDSKELREQRNQSPVKQNNSPQLILETQINKMDITDVDFSDLLNKINTKSQSKYLLNTVSDIVDDQMKEEKVSSETSSPCNEKEIEIEVKSNIAKDDLSPRLKKDVPKARIEHLHRESSSDNEFRKSNHRDDKKYIRKDYDKHTDRERRKNVETNRRNKDHIRDKKYYESDRDRYKGSRERNREARRRDWRSTRDKEKYKRDRSRSTGDTRRSRSPIDDRSRRVELIPLPGRLQSADKNDKNLKLNLEHSPNSPTGIKCSVADSTISDSELPAQTPNDEHFGVIQESPQILEKSYKASIPSPRSISPKSPKRISLDDRINQVLGIEKEIPKPIDTVYSQGSYSNYQMEYYEPYQNYMQTSNYDVYETPFKGSVNNSNYYNSYGSNIDSLQSHCTTRVLQVGNVLQVVPSESSHHEGSIYPKQSTTNNTTKVVQVGNMLQIVPTNTTPSESTPVNQSVTPTPDKIEITTIPLIGVEKEIMLKKAEKQKRRVEREERRRERRQKKIEKEKKRELKIKLKNENMIKRALMLESEDGLPELNSLESNKTNINADCDVKEDDDQPIMWPPPVLAPVPLPQPPAKGILVTPGFSKLTSISNDSPLLSTSEICTGNPIRKSVKFADGICPGEGTSPSGGEELPSPPPPPRKLPKEQRYKKTKLRSKKKVKVKIIRSLPIPPAPPPEESDNEEADELPPPPPPPGSPPPHLWPPNSHINNTHPSINNIPPYSVPQIPTTNPSFIQYSTRTSIHSNINMMYAPPIDSTVNSPFGVGSTFSPHPSFQPQSSNFPSGTNISTGLPSNYPGPQPSSRLAFNIPVIGTNNIMRSSTSMPSQNSTYHPPAFPVTSVGTSTRSFSSPPPPPPGVLLATKSTRKL